MLDSLLEATAVPNLHPALVHFPIALAAVALLFDAVAFAKRRWAGLDAVGAVLWVLAAGSAGAAYLAGERAADRVGVLEGAAEATLGKHEDAALASLLVLGLLAVFRVGLVWRDARAGLVRRDALRSLALVGALVAQALVAYTADLGGALVYRHGLAVSLARAASSDSPLRWDRPLEISRAPQYLPDGSLVWIPRARDRATPGEWLDLLGPTDPRWANAGAGVEGIALAAAGPALFGLPGSWEDARLEVRMDTSAFSGRLGLAARLDGETGGALFRVSTDGETALVARPDGQERILDEGTGPLPTGEVTLALSVSGRHWMGFVDGRRVVHGHASGAAPGRMALFLEGTGTLRVLSLRLAALDGGNPR